MSDRSALSEPSSGPFGIRSRAKLPREVGIVPRQLPGQDDKASPPGRYEFPGRAITQSPNISRRGRYIFPGGTICAKHPGFGDGSRAVEGALWCSIASRAGRYATCEPFRSTISFPERTISSARSVEYFPGGRYSTRWQTIFPGEDDISERARSVYRSATGEDQRIAFPGIRGMTLGRKYLTVFHLARQKSTKSFRQ
jgi:hypothetical protein